MTTNVAVIVAAVIGALGSGGVSMFIWWRQTRSPRYQRRVKDAWQKQAEQLQAKLEAQYEARIKDLKNDEQTRRQGGRPE